MKKILYLPIPLIGVSLIGITYFYLNMHELLYVHRLGCGCAPGFNTNHLTLTIWAMLFTLEILGSIRASKGMTKSIRIPYLAGSVILALYLSRFHFRYNIWL